MWIWCHICRYNTHDTAVASQYEWHWGNNPIEVKEHVCPQCGIRKHWWWFHDWSHLERYI